MTHGWNGTLRYATLRCHISGWCTALLVVDGATGRVSPETPNSSQNMKHEEDKEDGMAIGSAIFFPLFSRQPIRRGYFVLFFSLVSLPSLADSI